MAIGLAPLAEAALIRSPLIIMPTTVAFFVAVGSAVLLRRRYSWMGLVLHIFGQIAIWLSLFVMSLAITLFQSRGIAPRTNRSLVRGDTSVSRVASGPVGGINAGVGGRAQDSKPVPPAPDKGRNR